MSKGNVNKIILIGNLGHEPELRRTAKGNSVMSLSLATHRRMRTASGEKAEETNWHKATVWGKQAETCAKYLTKGSRVYLEGELRSTSWTDGSGNQRKSSEITVNEIHFLGGASTSGKAIQPEEEAVAMSH